MPSTATLCGGGLGGSVEVIGDSRDSSSEAVVSTGTGVLVGGSRVSDTGGSKVAGRWVGSVVDFVEFELLFGLG
jgi:hypothetical protein